MALFNGKLRNDPFRSRRWYKKQKIRLERRRAKRDLECVAQYRRYSGYD